MGLEQNEQLNRLLNKALKQSEAISRLTYDESILSGDVSSCCRLITETLVDVLDVSQSSIWFFSPDLHVLTCQNRFNFESQSHTDHGTLTTDEFPKYLEILKTEHRLYSTDVSKDERLSEMYEIYYLPEGILSTVEVGIRVSGKLAGVICNEDKKTRSEWLSNEIAFCKSMASLLALCITNAKQLNFFQDLERQKKLLEKTEKVALIGSWEWIVETDVAIWSDELFRILEYPNEKGAAKYEDFCSLFHPSCREALRTFVSKAITGNLPFQIPLQRIKSNKELQQLVIHGFPEIDTDGKVVRLNGCIQDVTEQTKLDRERQEKKQLYKSILSALSEGIIVQNNHDQISLCNESACEILHLTEAQVLRKTSFDPTWKAMKEDGTDFPPLEHPIIKTLRTGQAFDDVVMTIQVGENKRSTISINSRPVYNDQNVQVGAVASFHDITERKKAEVQLIVSEARNRAIVSAIPDLLFLLDENLILIQCHASDESLLVAPINEILGKPLESFVPASLYERTKAKAFECKSKMGSTSYQYELELPDGSHIFEARMVPCSDSEVLVIARDITERIKTQEAMQKIDRLESIGTLAGGIAHDFNNILMGFFVNLSLAREELEPTHPAVPFLQDAENCLTRASGLTQQLLTFSKGGKPIRQNVGLKELLQEVSRFDLSGSNVIAKVTGEENLWEAYGDKAQLEQVFSNLIVNANQAMPNGGHIHVHLENHTVAQSNQVRLSEGNYLKISIQDEGGGIPQKYLSKIFDPFFTTKHSGSGLGLATVYSIINKHGGSIDVHSVENHGTTFTIFLPASSLKKTDGPPRERESTPFPLNSRRVLLLEDQSAILKVVSTMLKKNGAAVHQTKDGKDTITRYREAFEAGRPYDIVIMDLTIPAGMGGKETIKEVLKIDPDAKCIVSSGYAEDPVMADYTSYGFKGMVVKPYTKSTLLNMMTQILEEKS